jgi:hypothetical protein
LEGDRGNTNSRDAFPQEQVEEENPRESRISGCLFLLFMLLQGWNAPAKAMLLPWLQGYM